MVDEDYVKLFADKIEELQDFMKLYLVHGYDQKTLIINEDSLIVGYFGMDGSVGILDANEFAEANRRVVVEGYAEV